MRLKGQLFLALGVENAARVTDAVVTSNRISVDWNEGGSVGHLDATSKDGVHFAGYYGYPQKDSDFEFELTLYEAKHEYLLFGTWCEHDTGQEGIWVFRLQTPSAKMAEPKIASKPRPIAKKPKSDSQPSFLETIRKQQKRAKSRQKKTTAAPTVQNNASKAPPPAVQPQLSQPKTASVAGSMPSARLDFLLTITPEELGKRYQHGKVAALETAPLSAVYKVANNAVSPALKEQAAQVFARRYGKGAAAKASAPAASTSSAARRRFSRKRR